MNLKDPAVFKDTYKKHYGLVVFTLRGFRLPSEDVDDVVQETFMRLFRSQDSVSEDKIKGFLIVAARNLVIDRLRKAKTQRTESVGETHDDHSDGLWLSDPQRNLECALVGEMIEEVARLPEGKAFGMFYRDGMTLKEIAGAIGEPQGTVAARISRLRSRFKESMRTRLEQIEHKG